MVPYAKACGACHDTVNFQTGENHSTGIVATDDQCVTCHGPTSTIDNGNLRVEIVHQIPEKLAGEKFQFNLLGVTNTAPGQAPVVTVLGDRSNQQRCALQHPHRRRRYVAAGGASTACRSISAGPLPSTRTSGSGSASGGTGTPAQPIQINPLTISGGTPATGPDAEGAFTSTSPVALPLDVDGSIGVALEGHPGVDANADGTADSIAVTNVDRLLCPGTARSSRAATTSTSRSATTATTS